MHRHRYRQRSNSNSTDSAEWLTLAEEDAIKRAHTGLASFDFPPSIKLCLADYCLKSSLHLQLTVREKGATARLEFQLPDSAYSVLGRARVLSFLGTECIPGRGLREVPADVPSSPTELWCEIVPPVLLALGFALSLPWFFL
uniref:Uncharacterized protein n=1 Tax=Chromera velia CCMP2878 TaxID=1169474 RepID=A0A0G4GDB1_9ALVE|eukprot:Cvel_615.t1-p1 / transcript=Cvel_615.t1 / gene=Cvel_615 / organism=Chromera_velia_CCMP2878 / gene_product=hypothetical protein / transcript_product=hypothetical protein / location=Cvel_scaffold19:30476-30898(-) / protein_length=141 / sequence_SO=supercontig / SO=protein_coding / is_pseudo=false